MSSAELAAASDTSKILLVLVGLPARGKSYVANKIKCFLRWRGVSCESFNVGAARRQNIGDPQNASFFSATNQDAKQKREALAMEVLTTALRWLDRGGNVAILDATNTTKSRRLHVLTTIKSYIESDGRPTPPGSEPGAIPSLPYVIFVECICNDPAVLRSNMLQKVTNSPDYCNMPVEAALADLQARIEEYQKVYESLDEASEDSTSPMGPLSYIKLIDLQSKVICRHIWGPIAFMIVSFLMVIHVGARPIWLVRAGQCTDDVVRAMIRTNAQSSGSTRTQSESRPPQLTETGSPDPPKRASIVRQSSVSTSLLMYPSLTNSAISATVANTALSAGLTLNANGRFFANALSDFVLRRVAGGPGPIARKRVFAEDYQWLRARMAAPNTPEAQQSPSSSFTARAPAGNEQEESSSETAAPRSQSGRGLRHTPLVSTRRLEHVGLGDAVRPLKIVGLVPDEAAQHAIHDPETACSAPTGLTTANHQAEGLGMTAVASRPDTPSASKSPGQSAVHDASGLVRKRLVHRSDGLGGPLKVHSGSNTPTATDSSSSKSPVVTAAVTPAANVPSAAEDGDDSVIEEGVSVSAPVIAQNDHYKKAGNAPNVPEVNEGNTLLVFDSDPAIYTSTLPRTLQTVEPLQFPSSQLSALNPMETGIPLQYLKDQFPDEYAKWQASPDRATYRIPGGESLHDVMNRLSPFVIELERQRRPVLVVSHLSTLQVLLAYFKGVPLEECVHLAMPMNTVVELQPHQYGYLERRFTFFNPVSDDTVSSEPHVICMIGNFIRLPVFARAQFHQNNANCGAGPYRCLSRISARSVKKELEMDDGISLSRGEGFDLVEDNTPVRQYSLRLHPSQKLSSTYDSQLSTGREYPPTHLASWKKYEHLSPARHPAHRASLQAPQLESEHSTYDEIPTPFQDNADKTSITISSSSSKNKPHIRGRLPSAWKSAGSGSTVGGSGSADDLFGFGTLLATDDEATDFLANGRHAEIIAAPAVAVPVADVRLDSYLTARKRQVDARELRTAAQLFASDLLPDIVADLDYRLASPWYELASETVLSSDYKAQWLKDRDLHTPSRPDDDE